MKKNTLIPVIYALVFLFVSCDSSRRPGNAESTSIEQNEGKATDDDAPSQDEELVKFVTEAASGGMMEVELGKWAQQNAASPRVKNFASNMVTDHSKANDELKKLAAGKEITLPTSLVERHAEHIKAIKSKTGAELDREYMKMMVQDHQEDVNKFSQAAEGLSDPDIKTFAANNLPVLKIHLDSANAINAVVNK